MNNSFTTEKDIKPCVVQNPRPLKAYFLHASSASYSDIKVFFYFQILYAKELVPLHQDCHIK